MQTNADPLAIRERRLILVLVVIGAIIRAGYCLARQHSAGGFEAGNVAAALATKGVYGDVFAVNGGPTAHLMPSMTLVGAGVYWLFGVRSVTSEAILAILSIATVLAVFLLGYRLFGLLGVSTKARITALGFLCAVPLFLAQEAVNFRLWDGALAVLLLLTFLNLLLGAREEQSLMVQNMSAGLAALIAFVSPGAGLAALAVLVGRLRRLRRRRLALAGLSYLLSLILLFAPWTLRNFVAMHEPIVLRDNIGLELALANYPGALGPMTYAKFQDRLHAIHPMASAANRERMVAAGGEAAYSRALGIQANTWIRSDPLGFAKLCARHLREYFLPLPWQFETANFKKFTMARSILFSLVSALGLIGVAWALLRGSEAQRLVAIATIVPGLPYMFFQPVPRYSWLVYPMLMFWAAKTVELAVYFYDARIAPLRAGANAPTTGATPM